MKVASLLLVAAVAAIASPVFAADGRIPVTVPERVLVIPFNTLNVPESQQWIGRGIQENLIADLGHSGIYSPVGVQSQVIVEDNATAARLAKAAGMPLALRGAAQMVGDTVRITAQLIDAQTGDTVNTASVTGPSVDMLKLEDQLAAQVRGVSQPAATTSAVPTPMTPAPFVPGTMQPPPAQVSGGDGGGPAYYYAPGNSYYPDSYSYPYDYYGYAGYPGYYPYYPFFSGFVVVGSDHHHDHDHDGDHGHYHGGPAFPHGGSAGGSVAQSSSGRSFSPGTSLPIPSSGVGLPLLRGNSALPIAVNTSSPAAHSFSGGFSGMGGAHMAGGRGR